MTGEDAQRDGEQVGEALRGLGLTEYEVRVYLGILRHPLSRIPEIARHANVPQPKVYATVKRLIARGLCESHLGPVNTYSAVPPESAFTPLVEDLERQHQAALSAVGSLQEQYATPADAIGAREGRIKLFQGKQANLRNFRFLFSNAQRDVTLISRLPIVVRDDDDLIEDAIARGVRVRILVEMPADFDPLEDEVFARQLALGCESRRITHVPMRLGVFDGRAAILPMQDPSSGGDGIQMLEVRNESLSAGLTEIFEMLWSGAEPLVAPRPAGVAKED